METAYWEGGLDYRGARMPVRLHVEPHEEGVRAWLDLPDLMMAWEPIPAAFEQGRLALEFPFGIGPFEFEADGGSIEARRSLGDGTVTLRLAPADPPSFTRRALTIPADDVGLSGELVLPGGAGPHPGVVLLHGSSQGGRSNWAYRSWAHWLVRAGFATLYYDRRPSTGPDAAGMPGLSRLARDAAAAVRALRAQERIDADRVGLKGGSQGAWLALEAAAELGDLAFLVLASAPAVTPRQQELQQIEFGMRADGVSETLIEDALNYMGLYFYVVRTGRGWSELERAIVSAQSSPWGQYVDQPRSEDDLAWWRANHGFQPASRAARLELPVLLLYGGADWITPAAANAERLRRLFARPDSVMVRVFDGADHRLEVPAGFDADGRWHWPRMAPGLRSELERWLAVF